MFWDFVPVGPVQQYRRDLVGLPSYQNVIFGILPYNKLLKIDRRV